MIGERLLVVAIAGAVGVLFLLGYGWYRVRSGVDVERLDVDALGLELMSGCCAFVVFTSPACRPCKAALRVVSAAAKRRDDATEVTTVDAAAQPDLAVRYDVRTIPTVFLITASGHVVRRWKQVPDPSEVESALSLV